MLPSGGTGCGAVGPGSTWGRAERSGCCATLCHPSPRTPPGPYLGHDGIGRPGAALGAPRAAGAAGGGRQLLQEGTDGSGWVVCASSPCRGHSPTWGCPWGLGPPTLTGSWGPDADVVWGCWSLAEWPGGTRGVRALRSQGWLSQELRVALRDGPAGTSPLGSGDGRRCLGSREGAGQGIGSLWQTSEPCPAPESPRRGWLTHGATQPGVWLPHCPPEPLLMGPACSPHTSAARFPPRSPAGGHRGWARLGLPPTGAALREGSDAALHGRVCLPSLAMPPPSGGSPGPPRSSSAPWAGTAAGAGRGFPAAGHGFLPPSFAAASPGTPGSTRRWLGGGSQQRG